MAIASPTPQPLPADAEPGRGLLPAVRLAHRAARTTGSLFTRNGPGAKPWWLPVADLPAYLPVFATPDTSRKRERLNDQAGARHPATAAASDAAAVGELPVPGGNLYASKVAEPVPGQDALELWEHVARFGTAFIYTAMRSLSAAVLTYRAAIDLPDREAHLEALRRHWLVDWITDGEDMWPSGPAGHTELLAELANAVTACRELRGRRAAFPAVGSGRRTGPGGGSAHAAPGRRPPDRADRPRRPVRPRPSTHPAGLVAVGVGPRGGGAGRGARRASAARGGVAVCTGPRGASHLAGPGG